MTELMASAVVYGKKDVAVSVNRAWLDAALDFLAGHGLLVREFEMQATPTSTVGQYSWPKDESACSARSRVASVHSAFSRIRKRSRVWHGVGTVIHTSAWTIALFSWEFPPPWPSRLPTFCGTPTGSPRSSHRSGTAFRICCPPLTGRFGMRSVSARIERRVPRTRQSREIEVPIEQVASPLPDDTKLLAWVVLSVTYYPANLLCEDHVRAALPGGRALKRLAWAVSSCWGRANGCGSLRRRNPTSAHRPE